MDEFTYEGMVRLTYGFYNPNHAAALLCALIPFVLLWMTREDSGERKSWRKYMRLVTRVSSVFLLAVILVLLALTWSRTGILVAIAEILFFCWCGSSRVRKCWRWWIVGLVLFVGGLVTGGMTGRFSADASVWNRLDIWLSACQLTASNPMGVGGGNSGLLATLFLLPDGINCRTMVNSHLTLLAEYGWIAGFVWLASIGYALFTGWKRSCAVWTAFAGLCISAWLSSIFDWQILWDIEKYGGLTMMNFYLSWITLILWLGMFVYLVWGRMQWKFMIVACGLSTCCIVVAGVIGVYGGLRVEEGCVVCENKNDQGMSLVLYDESWTMADAVWFMESAMPSSGFYLPLVSAQNQQMETLPLAKDGKVVLQGECCWIYPHYAGSRLVMISPPEGMLFPETVDTVYLKRYVDNRASIPKDTARSFRVVWFD